MEKKRRAIEAALFTIIGFGIAQLIRLISNIVLTRLLIPEYFGVISIAFIIQQGLFFLSDIGLSPSIVRSERSVDPDFLNTAWTIQSIRGLFLFIIILVISYPIAIIYKTPILFAIIPVISLSSLLQGVTSTSIFILQKELKQKILVTAEIIFQLTGTLISLLVAYLTKSIWSLIISGIVISIMKCIWSHSVNNFKHKFLLERKALQDILSFGRWIMLSTAVFYLASQIDRLLLGKFFTMSLFGVYNIALVFAELPKNIIEKLSGSIIFPLITNLKKEEMVSKIKKPRSYMLLFFSIALAIAITFSDYVIIFLYDTRYQAAAWMLPLLLFGIWPRLLILSVDRCLLAIGKPKYLAFGNISKLLYMVIFLPLFFHFYGVLGAVIAVTLNDIPLYISTYYGLFKEKLNFLKQDILFTIILIIIISIFIGIRVILGLGIPGVDFFTSYRLLGNNP